MRLILPVEQDKKRTFAENAAEAARLLTEAFHRPKEEPTIEELVGKAREFRFRSIFGVARVAAFDEGYWTVTDSDFVCANLRELQQEFNIALSSIIPLEVSRAYVEARR